MMTVAAELLPAIPAPPHDPTWLRLSADTGWALAAASRGVEITPADAALVLVPAPDSGPDLTAADGGVGGLVAPRFVTVDGTGAVWLLDRARPATLGRLDACACTFGPAAGFGPRQIDPRRPEIPQAIAAAGNRLYIADGGPADPRIIVLSVPQLGLVDVLRPDGALATSWRPAALAVDGRRRVLVADPANGMIHRFTRHGRWLAPPWTGVGAVSVIATDAEGRVYAGVPGETFVRVLSAQGAEIERLYRIEQLAGRLGPSALRIDASGQLIVEGFCAGVATAVFGTDGVPRPDTTEVVRRTTFVPSGTYVSRALDSRISRCTWHRLLLTADLPERSTIELSTLTADVQQPDDLIAGLTDAAWTPYPGFATGGTCETLILSPPGRYLWVKLRLRGDGADTPRIRRVDLEFPRISLRRFLPAVFGEEPVAADFTDRLLAIFDAGFRSIERQIDGQAALYDPRSTPATGAKRGHPDFLTWLASWVGLVLDSRLPEATRRRLVAEVPSLYACRGTPAGLRRMLGVYLGIDARTCAATPCPWGPRCPGPQNRPPSLPLVLEHFRLRRWLFLGAGLLGEEATLWGRRIVNRSQLDGGARLDSSQLKTTPDPLHDPFLAHTFSVFLPANLVTDERRRRAMDRLIATEKPAHTRHIIHYVAPRFRVGVQATLGFDAAVGDYPAGGVRLDSDLIGRGTLLQADPARQHDTMAVSRGTRVGVTTRLD